MNERTNIMDVLERDVFKVGLACKNPANYSNLCDLINCEATELWLCIQIRRVRSTMLFILILPRASSHIDSLFVFCLCVMPLYSKNPEGG